ncbi:MAG: hypothetical protein OQJ81_05435 [Melioribacteraceae bacterium]|nr:hypothetical protein [Melioribacteraceae bacterium]
MKISIKQITLIILFLTLTQLSAQYDFVSTNSYSYPNPHKFNHFKSLFSITLAKLPEDVIEEASSYIYAPLLNYDVLYGLPIGFSAHGNFSTNWVTAHLLLGSKWSYRYKRVSVAVGYDVAYVYGRLYKFGFNSEIKGWLNYPNITFGLAFDKFTLSFKGDVTFITNLDQFNDDLKVGTDKNRMAGLSFKVTVEQPLWKNNFVSVSFRGNFTRLYYPSWAVFPTWERYNFIPEVVIGLVL